MQTVGRLLTSRWGVPLIALVGILLNAPGLNAKLFADDFLQWALLTQHAGSQRPPGSPFGLFNLVGGDEAQVQSLKASGRLLWSASDNLRMSFWRPFAELTHWVDYRFWPDSPLLMHAHSLAWYGLLILLLGLLYRSLDDNRLRSGMATSLYAISSLHFFAIAWLSARNQLISTCFTVMAIMAHHAWRSGKGVRFAWLSPACLLLGLASAEAAVATLAYLAAYEVVIKRDQPWRERWMALLPAAIVVVGWRVLYQHAGYGALGSGSYIDPGANPGRFGLALLLRLPALLLAALTGASSAIPHAMTPSEQAAYAVIAAAIVAVLGLAMRAYGVWQHRLARFFGLGTLLALIPVCAVETNDRVLIHAEIGMSGLIAILLHRLLSRWRADAVPCPRFARIGAVLLLVVHAVVFPIISATASLLTGPMLTPSMYGEALSLPDMAGQPDAHVMLLNPPSPGLLFYYPLVRSHAGLHNPQSIQALATNLAQDLTLTVVDAQTLRVSSAKPFIDPLTRDLVTEPLKPGDTLNMGDIAVRIEQVNHDGAPMRVSFHFPSPLTDPVWRFYAWHAGGYQAYALPEVGQTRYLPAVDVKQTLKARLRGRDGSQPALAAPIPQH